jgi:bacteriorhodopsin
MEEVRPTFAITFFAFLIVFFYVIANKKDENDNIEKIQFLEASILFIAFLSYLVIYNVSDVIKGQRWRYLDWILTTPLLLGIFYLLAVEKGYEKSIVSSIVPAIVANTLMILFRYWAEFPETSPIYGKYTNNEIKNIFFFLSFLSLAVVFYYVYDWDNSLKNNGIDTEFLPYFFYIGWTLYGLFFLVKNEEIRQSAFDLLDLFAKPVYTVYLTDFIERNFI